MTDDLFVGRAVGRLLATRQPVQVAGSIEEARVVLAHQTSWNGLVVDADSNDGGGLDLLAWARRHSVALPAAVLTYREEPDLKRRVRALDAVFVDKLLVPDSLSPLIERLPKAIARVDAVDLTIAALIQRAALTPREADIVVRAVAGASREAIAQALGISLNTLKTHVRALLHKVGAINLDEVALAVFRDARIGTARSRW